MASRLTTLVCVLALCSSSSCAVKYLVAPDELKNLDGYDAHNERTVIGLVPTTYQVGTTTVVGTATVAKTVTDRPFRLIHHRGRTFDFNSTVPLGFRTTNATGEPHHWRKISLIDGRLVAESLASGANLEAPWGEVKAGVIHGTSIGRGFAISGGIIAAAGLGVLIAGLAAVSWNTESPRAILPLSLGGGALAIGVVMAAVSPLFGWNLDADE